MSQGNLEIDLQFNILGVVQKLEQVIVLCINDVVVHKCRHCNYVLRLALQLRLLHEFIMLGQYVVDINFLYFYTKVTYGSSNKLMDKIVENTFVLNDFDDCDYP
jgi:hypothetical protein